MLNTIAGLEGCFHFGMSQSLSVIIECNSKFRWGAAISRVNVKRQLGTILAYKIIPPSLLKTVFT